MFLPVVEALSLKAETALVPSQFHRLVLGCCAAGEGFVRDWIPHYL